MIAHPTRRPAAARDHDGGQLEEAVRGDVAEERAGLAGVDEHGPDDADVDAVVGEDGDAGHAQRATRGRTPASDTRMLFVSTSVENCSAGACE